MPAGQPANQPGVAEILLSDRLPNGAGFVNYLFKNYEQLLQEICSPVPSTGSYSGTILSSGHIASCDSACYDCLKVYRNMTYHGLLDWRLALAYLRILANNSYCAGLDGVFNTPELEKWLETATILRDNFISLFPGYHPVIWNQLPGFIAGRRHVIVVHPFWDTYNPKGILAKTVAEAGGDVAFIDTFNLLRRPGKCHSFLEA